MIKIYQAPKSFVSSKDTHPSLFLAGGITNCPDWRIDLINLLDSMDSDLNILNPKRDDWDLINEQEEGKKQIVWEHLHLLQADAISFWFPEESICPITLFELGSWLPRSKQIFVGVDPNYKRKFDVTTQISLERESLQVVDTIRLLAQQIKSWEDKVVQQLKQKQLLSQDLNERCKSNRV